MAGQGLQFLPLERIPSEWDPQWFAQFVRDVLSNADVRNAIEGSGISITGQPGEPATVSTSSDLSNLLATSFVVLTPSGLNTERVLTGESGVVTITDNGANTTVAISLTLHGVPLRKLELMSNLGILGNKFASVSEVQPIVPSGDKAVLAQNGAGIEFDLIDHTFVSDFDEAAQDAAGAALTNTASIALTYTDGANTITADIVLTFAPTWTGKHTHTRPIGLAGFTVATLPAGTVGDRAYVTDATAPTYNAAVVGGGAIVVPVFYNGTAWVTA